MTTTATKMAAKAPAALWIQNPAIDLIVGCGAWSAPLLLLSYFALSAHVAAWAVAFYALALFFNYPHYMATIYRAYHTAEDFQKYRIFTVHITALVVLTVVLSHFYVRLLPWIFTLYLTWSPWHYSGQNYGLFMMFARRAGASPSKNQRRALYSVFLLTYAVLFLNLHAGPSSDQLFLSLGLPVMAVRWATIALTFVCVGLSAYGLMALSRQVGSRSLVPSMTLLSTQFLWFLIPSLLAASGRISIPQSRYSTGVMAVMHSAQYLWITSYYAKREATTATSRWRPWAYFAILVAGGIALFVPGPWLASYVFHFDFTNSFLIFTALVNLHHFILDGAIWKLRDGRIASLLLNAPSRLGKSASEVGGGLVRFARWSVSPASGARALRIGAAGLLVMLAVLDQTRFVLGMNTEQPERLERAAALNPFDGTVQLRVAQEEAAAGHTDAAWAAFRRAQDERPRDPAVRDAYLRFLISQQHLDEAFQLTGEWLHRTPNDANLLINRGILANSMGKLEIADASWEQALRIDPSQLNAHLYLAEMYDKQNQGSLALPHYRAYLDGIAVLPPGRRPRPEVVVGALVEMADCQARAGDGRRAVLVLDTAERIAKDSGDPRLQSMVATTAAELENKLGYFSDALRLYQQALRLDSTNAVPELEASDLFNYAQILREHHLEGLAYACVFRARAILQADGKSPEMATIDKSLKDLEAQTSAVELAKIRKDPNGALAQALSLLN